MKKATLMAVAMATMVTGSLHAAEQSVAPGSCRPAAALPTATTDPAARSAFRYDIEYPSIGYSGAALTNEIARLEARLAGGALKLQYRAGRGYLESLLGALGIDRSSQLLVYSKSSVQRKLISGSRPRALYFNDATYVGWVQGSDQIEVATIDCEKGPVFYLFHNQPGPSTQFKREFAACLSCHDSAGMLGGGVPALTAYSMPVDGGGVVFPNDDPVAVTDATPLERRWAGWYVTGSHGAQAHLGNLLVSSAEEFRAADLRRNGNRASVSGLIDSQPYLTDKSDIVALMVFEHQAALHSLFARTTFKAREFLTRDLGATSLEQPFSELPPRLQALFRRLLEPVVRGLLFADAVTFTDSIRGNSGFQAWFEAQGPRDAAGRSLREFDLTTRLFRYPLSYLVYSEAFDGLPRSVREHLYARLLEVLSGGKGSENFSALTAGDRQAILEILKATKPEFARVAASTRELHEPR